MHKGAGDGRTRSGLGNEGGIIIRERPRERRGSSEGENKGRGVREWEKLAG